ncbi:hypothetical protein KP509_25G012900 [Ceratopteris richardii]|uniref:EF-hand domain-containing protein n=1 Tax=Ceratopteris richardii TaxID=49495 RepID=A0A8T2RP55_CERRI|nr:hypothetical protein KP509_25G012900 [Ceratopteris richardii]
MALTYSQLRSIAELWHEQLPEPVKLKESELFQILDVDNDGKVTLQELLTSRFTEKFAQDFLENLFYNLDAEEKGYLDFTECLTVNYVCNYTSRVCGGCGYNITQGLGYTCLRCLNDMGSETYAKVFSVCLYCYSSRNYRHSHHAMHLLHDFVLLERLLDKWPSTCARVETASAPNKEAQQVLEQCAICGDHHNVTARGFTCNTHMVRMGRESVCEWCSSYFCSRCGNHFHDGTTRAEPGKWLKRNTCLDCRQRNIATDCYNSALQRMQKKLARADLLQQCRTCEIKQRNGTLFWVVNNKNALTSSAAALRSSTVDAFDDVANFGVGVLPINRSSDVRDSGGGADNGVLGNVIDGRTSGASCSRLAGHRGQERLGNSGNGGTDGYMERNPNQRREEYSSNSSSINAYNGNRTGERGYPNRPSGAADAAMAISRVLHDVDPTGESMKSKQGETRTPVIRRWSWRN